MENMSFMVVFSVHLLEKLFFHSADAWRSLATDTGEWVKSGHITSKLHVTNGTLSHVVSFYVIQPQTKNLWLIRVQTDMMADKLRGRRF